MRDVLSVASECAPLVKTGGLADVVGALPSALAAHEVRVRTLLPGYPAVMTALGSTSGTLCEEEELFGGPARILAGEVAGLDLLVLDAPHLFAREGSIYLGPDGADWSDNAERFAALSWMAARIGGGCLPGWTPQVIHAHDWQAALVADHLAMQGVTGIGTVLTIHNIAFQGLFEAHRLEDLRLDPARYHSEGFEYWGKVSALKAGLTACDRLTTVSPGYANELMRPEFGMGLDGVMRARRAELTGILNGIDEAVWNPAEDSLIPAPYKRPRGKAANKAALQAEFGLPEAEGPLCIVVSRLTEQKGLDLLVEALPVLLERGGQLALLGTGNRDLEATLTEWAETQANVAVQIGYDEALSHRMMAGADAILVPSRFEPCGLTQLYGLRYGTLPVVALTGGLADTVINASPAALSKPVATGLQFWPADAEALKNALARLCNLYSSPSTFRQLQKNAMAQPVGWNSSAAAYARLYDEVSPA
ncbi:glycogen synthase GlgA [Pseudoroseicyclus tamaricis]|uniref:Glycogen synthase n=1 Tax=Pseudoroseicyclus tamaricis TaxID=2705421 RepID=A0A6B2JSG5_9RHOB|nr:glycogen synthase GlgA [Pseudoroseicyclus tamaricis]NDV00940.1 glycogen synthase GlgA [Pseudoroseicyclus tamaricis]